MQDSYKNNMQADYKHKMQQNLSVVQGAELLRCAYINPYGAHRAQTGTKDAENGGRYMPI